MSRVNRSRTTRLGPVDKELKMYIKNVNLFTVTLVLTTCFRTVIAPLSIPMSGIYGVT